MAVILKYFEVVKDVAKWSKRWLILKRAYKNMVTVAGIWNVLSRYFWGMGGNFIFCKRNSKRGVTSSLQWKLAMVPKLESKADVGKRSTSIKCCIVDSFEEFVILCQSTLKTIKMSNWYSLAFFRIPLLVW